MLWVVPHRLPKRIPCERLAPRDTRILAGAASDNMSAAVHVRLRLVEIAGIERRKNLVAVAVGQHAGAVDVFCLTER
jgi:hypothetical protein